MTYDPRIPSDQKRLKKDLKKLSLNIREEYPDKFKWIPHRKGYEIRFETYYPEPEFLAQGEKIVIEKLAQEGLNRKKSMVDIVEYLVTYLTLPLILDDIPPGFHLQRRRELRIAITEKNVQIYEGLNLNALRGNKIGNLKNELGDLGEYIPLEKSYSERLTVLVYDILDMVDKCKGHKYDRMDNPQKIKNVKFLKDRVSELLQLFYRISIGEFD